MPGSATTFRVPRLLLTATLGLAAAASPAAAAPAPTPADLRTFASAHYHIHTDLDRRQTVPFGRHMDLLFKQYERRFRRLGGVNNPEMPLYLLSTEDRYQRFMRHLGVPAQNSGGMFFVTRRDRGVATWANGRSRTLTRRTLQHEGFHQFAHDHFGDRLPAWTNEGLAQYFGDAILLDRGFELGLADPDRMLLVRRALETDTALPLSALLDLGGDDWHRTLTNDHRRAGLLYAQAWSVVYYLIHGDHAAHQPKFELYLKLLGEGFHHAQAFPRAFGDDPAALERGWKRWARQQLPDAVTVAAARLGFLGDALAYKASRGEPMPDDLADLQHDLTQRGFALTRTVYELERELRGDQPELYTYTRPGGEATRFLWLEPSRRGLPPRLAAVGLTPEPTLEWERDGAGELTYDIVYR